MVDKEKQLLAEALVNLKIAQKGISVVRNTLTMFSVSPGVEADITWAWNSVYNALVAVEELTELMAKKENG